MPTESDIQTFRGFFVNLRNRITKEQRERGIRASGKSAGSLRFTIDQSDSKTIGKLFGEDYFQQQEFGLPPFSEAPAELRGKYPTIAEIVEWMSSEGRRGSFSDVPEEDRTDVARRIVEQIYTIGTRTYNNPRLGLPLSQIYAEGIKELRPKLEGARISDIAKRFKTAFQ